MLSLPRDHPREPGDTWCRWGGCTSNGVLLATSLRVTDKYGAEYHPGCHEAMVQSQKRHDEQGSAVLEFMLVLGFIMLPMMFLITATTWPARVNAANAAAYEAAKAVVAAPNPAAAEDTGRARALEVIANHGFDTADVTVSFNLADPGHGDVLTASVTITLPALQFPTFGAWDAIRTTRSSSQRVGDYRGFE